MIVDAHCHAWHAWPYEPAVPDPRRGSAPNLLWEMDRAGVARAVVVCASIGPNLDNASDVTAEAGRAGGRLIPFVDVDCRWSPTHLRPGAAGRLEAALARFEPAGVTFYLKEDGPADWLTSDEGQAFLAVLAGRRMALSLACGPSQSTLVQEMARRNPGLPILVHHLWRVRAGDREALSAAVQAAAQPNIHVKLSGFGYGVEEGWDFPLRAMREVVEALIAAYGPRRLLWGSDWPVSQRFMTYRQSLEIVRRLDPTLGKMEMQAIMGGNILRILEG
ncbi:MAG: amidohydrolase family protein [Hyphomicrobiales bacterium]|nr:amidohydrolase family protein [Hyphomicrobiales bacterium]